MATTKNTKAATAPETTGTAIAVAAGSALSVASDFIDFNEGTGFEGVDKDSFAIPFLQILQKMSPLVDEDNPAYIPGARAGMFYNTVTKRLYDGKAGVVIIPCAYKRSFIQWGAREGAEGGFKGEFTPEQIAEMQASGTIVTVEGRLYKPLDDGSVNEKKCDYYADTRSHYIVINDEESGEFGRAVLSLASSQIKASKMLMTSLHQKKVETSKGKQTPPTFANLVHLSTTGLSNDKGSWSGATFELAGLVSQRDLYEEAKSFYKDISAGAVKADYSKAEQADAGGTSTGKPQDADQF